ncbi:MAG: crossover junction endodeoxyribonuclease RuvC [Provencibacterium sp.]|jgi:crossover junction endodeoxyribonuclease RuvC|nr:crossover junction endodeoxyribonuclease RuvC [Provencibacterium sp.]
MRILGIDPGYAIVGYGMIEHRSCRFRPLEYGAVLTEAGVEFTSRLQNIYLDLQALLERLQPEAVAVERLYFTTNQKTGIDVAQARGVILLAVTLAGIPVYEYTPLQVKQAVAGYGKAEKHQVMAMTQRILKLKEIPKPDDAADALAIAICHAHSAGSSLNGLIRKAGAR